MELNATTLILELINFGALVWILKRLFFAPVKKVIEERKAAVAKTVEDARKLKVEAEELQVRYQGRLQEWENEKAKARQELEQSLGTERARRLTELDAVLQSEREKRKAQDERKAAELRDSSERAALKLSSEFASRLLSELAGPGLEARIVDVTVDHLRKEAPFPPEGQEVAPSNPSVLVRTAFELSNEKKEAIQGALGPGGSVDFSTDPSLVAGIEILRGSRVLRANLRDELAYFSEPGNS